MEGLSIEGHGNGSQIEVVVGPGEQKEVQLVSTGLKYTFGLNLNYYIEG